MNSEQYPLLFQLFGANFHQDWMEDDDDPQLVLRRYITGLSAERLNGTLAEIEKLLRLEPGEAALEQRIVRSLGSSYGPDPEEKTYRHWLREIQEWIREELKRQAKRGTQPAD
jgi:hypothetical protein